MHRRLPLLIVFALAAPLLRATMLPPALGQDALNSPSTALVVDGKVENVFQSGDDYLVQILVRRSEAPRLDALAGTTYPAPGQFVYAHVGESRAGVGRSTRDRSLPQPQSQIRAFLAVGSSGQWQASGEDWYQANPSNEDPADGESPASGAGIGLTTQRVNIGRQGALKVVRVIPDSAAANAGIEPGDILVEANREALQSQNQLAEAYRKSHGQFSLTVRDVRTGRDVLVPVAAGAAANSPGSMTRNRSMLALGATTELAFLNGEPVVKVTEVETNSPAALGGLKKGWLVLEADGESIASPQDLTAAEQASRGRMELVVVDPKDDRKREQTLRISLGR
ncbi:PDZ domain-containing protein [Allorhodopirellula solitaria]|nr:PDZ domain-containing protein [Allorhodopirellula solitaria]